MEAAVASPASSKTRVWTGIALSALPVLFLLFDAFIKLIQIDPVRESFERLGTPEREMGVGGS